jgi:hypothetical protein
MDGGEGFRSMRPLGSFFLGLWDQFILFCICSLYQLDSAIKLTKTSIHRKTWNKILVISTVRR